METTALLNLASARLPGALMGVIQLELEALLKDFLEMTNVLVDTVAVPVVPSKTSYPVMSFLGVVNRLMTVLDNNNNPLNASLVVPNSASVDFSVSLQYAPSQAATYTAYVAVLPDPGTPIVDAVPDWIWTKYRNGLMDGLLARMMIQPAKPYSNAQLAAVHEKLFRKVQNQARNDMLRQYKFRGQGWIFPQAFAASSQRI
jgi:hypothetical protein